MGKIKSAIITALLVAAIVVLGFFATVSYTVPGSNGVKRYNSFISSIHMGGDLTGEARTVLYPKGVISVADYKFGIPDDTTSDEYAEYIDKYESYGSVYVEKEVLGENKANEADLKADVLADAKVISKRLGDKGYSAYSVSVQDDFTIAVTVPTNFTNAAYKQYDTTARSNATSAISQALRFLAYNGELTLRNSEVTGLGGGAHDSNGNYLLTGINDDVASYFKSVKKFTSGKTHAVKVSLTKSGVSMIKTVSGKVSGASSDKAIGFYVGEKQLLALTVDSAISNKSFYITVNSEQTAKDYAIVLNSCVKGLTVTLDYQTDKNVDVVFASSSLGKNAPLFLGIVMLVLLLAVLVYSVVRYRKLGLVFALSVLIYALAIIIALLLIEIQLTLAGAVVCALGLALVFGVHYALFERVRIETKKGKTMQSAVKSAYKALLKCMLVLHAVLVGASIILTLVCVGEASACGLILLIASVASALLFWVTRFMWYVISSPVKDKFAFCGFKREELLDD